MQRSAAGIRRAVWTCGGVALVVVLLANGASGFSAAPRKTQPLQHPAARTLAATAAQAPLTTDAATGTSFQPVPATEPPPEDVGVWSTPFLPPTKAEGIHSVLLHNGKVLYYSGYWDPNIPTENGGYAAVLDPTTNTVTEVDTPSDLFCGGQTILADGRVLVVGGLIGAPGTKQGQSGVFLFDPTTNTWSQESNMVEGRWYPTVTELANGQALIQAGLDQNAQPNSNIELYTEGSTAPPQVVGTYSFIGNTDGTSPAADATYPRSWLMPDGKVLDAVPVTTEVVNPNTWSWKTLRPMRFPQYLWPAGVLLPGGPSGSTTVFLVGGKSTAKGATTIKNTESYDYANPKAGWTKQASMPQARTNMNLVILPDGTVLGVGGASSGLTGTPQYQSLLYNPSTNVWTPMASQQVRRSYHSTAILLPDGRVLSAGDNRAGGGKRYLDYYSPPYLFKGPRPTITSVSSSVTYGQSFTIDTPDTITSAVLMAPGAVTHSFDMHQRSIQVTLAATAGGYTATAPLTANIAPPGYYMLFLLNAAGVPSVASWVHLG